MSTFLVGAAFAVLLALAIATVITGIVTALRIGPPPPPITRHGHWEPHTHPDGTTEHTWTPHQTDPKNPQPARGHQERPPSE
ncbi:hypothetical protein SAMN05216371_5640 [Streptomyces sp. TLI_053]|uniref:hypothetical protein n=1 Tax=Streptomyces sp. TLI_053 TaxID=1855352 RepID=UPI00087D3902|nr:hypothetical protein [Streptomyces sp. TLI_053]SDT78147.1 hypothetical protein SAMN05216371_5640 [Streptomyces sp. TLI_053]